MKKKLITLTLLVIVSPSLYAAGFYAKVVKLKGQVSQLAPHARKATWVEEGQMLKEDTSLVSRKKSFLVVKVLGDGSNVTLGPESKLVLNKLEKSKGSIVTVLTGTIRAQIKKRKGQTKKETKFFIRTQTAAMGVRGTEFIVAVNQQNKVTSLVTLDGEVDMVKTDTLRPDIKVEDEIKESLNNESVTTVKKGRASTSYLHKNTVTTPQKVNPAQLVALKENKTLDDSTIGKQVENLDISSINVDELYAPETEEEKAMDLVDVTKEGAKGGIVDLKSGIFIPPTEEDIKVGKVDTKSGQYIPEEGIKLDVIQGFVADANNDKAKKEVEKLKELVEYKPLPKDYIAGHEEGTTGSRPFSKDFRFMTELGVHFTHVTINNPDNDRKTTFMGRPMPHLNMALINPRSWRLAWRMEVRVDSIAVDEGKLSSAEKPRDDNYDSRPVGFGGGLGMDYQLSPDFTLKGTALYAEELVVAHVVDPDFVQRVVIKPIWVPQLDFSFENYLSSKWKLIAGYRNIFSGSDEITYISEGKEARVGLKWFTTKNALPNWYIKWMAKHKELEVKNVVQRNETLAFTVGKWF